MCGKCGKTYKGVPIKETICIFFSTKGSIVLVRIDVDLKDIQIKNNG